MTEWSLAELSAAVPPPDPQARRRFRFRQSTLARPLDSLGQLDDLAARLAGIFGTGNPGPRSSIVSVLAADHGVAERAVSAHQPDVTAGVFRLIRAGRAPVNILAARAGAPVALADFGLRENSGAAPFKVACGTGDISRQDAMTVEQARRAVESGARYAHERLGGADLVAVGEIGVGNTTVSSALAARLLGSASSPAIGTGSGVDGDAFRRKRALVKAALARTAGLPDEPLQLLAALGGLEIAGNVGVILQVARRGGVVVLDGYITGVAALLAERFCPSVRDHLVASHRSAEVGHGEVLARLGQRPLLDLGLRLGMASGAALALPLVNAVLAVAHDVAPACEVGLAGRA